MTYLRITPLTPNNPQAPMIKQVLHFIAHTHLNILRKVRIFLRSCSTVSELLSAHAERFSVSRVWDFYSLNLFNHTMVFGFYRFKSREQQPKYFYFITKFIFS